MAKEELSHFYPYIACRTPAFMSAEYGQLETRAAVGSRQLAMQGFTSGGITTSHELSLWELGRRLSGVEISTMFAGTDRCLQKIDAVPIPLLEPRPRVSNEPSLTETALHVNPV